jgi:hypothetical protein
VKPFEHALAVSTTDNGNVVALLHRMLQGIAILDVHTPEHVSFLGYQHRSRGKHAINVKDKRSDTMKFLQSGWIHGANFMEKGGRNAWHGNMDE